MFAVQYWNGLERGDYSSLTRIDTLEWPGKGHYSSQTQINSRGQNAATIRVISWAIIEVRSGSLVSYGTHQETISRRPEQMYTPSDIILKWPGEEPLFESDSNTCREAEMGPLFESPPGLSPGPGRLFRYGTHQTISGRLKQVYLPSDPRLEWPGEGPLFELDLDEWQGAKMWALFESPLGHYLCQAWALDQI